MNQSSQNDQLNLNLEYKLNLLEAHFVFKAVFHK